jgi:glycosyltransferase involved in cell wall biosynthesis
MVVSVIHEMGSVIHALKVADECKAIGQYAHQVVFPANIVRNDFEAFSGPLGTRAIINPQGLLRLPVEIPGAKERVCDLLNIPYDSILVLAAGVGDLRKGLDLYLQIARQLGLQDNRFHFIWVGNIAHDSAVWFKQDIDTELLRRCFHHIPFTAELSLYFQSANVFVLTSREDPFPSVVIDALAYGIPVIAFDKCGGYVDLLAAKLNGELVTYGDMEAMTGAIQRIATDKTMLTPEAKRERSKPIIERFDFKRYAGNLLQLFDCKLPSN